MADYLRFREKEISTPFVAGIVKSCNGNILDLVHTAHKGIIESTIKKASKEYVEPVDIMLGFNSIRKELINDKSNAYDIYNELGIKLFYSRI